MNLNTVHALASSTPNKEKTVSLRIHQVSLPLAVLLTAALTSGNALAQKLTGAVYTTNKAGTAVNWNIYDSTSDVYISGGPQNTNASGLPDGTYYFQVTDPSGHTLLSTDNAVCRQLIVSGGHVSGATGPCPHANGTFNPDNNTLPVQLLPYAVTPNDGGEYKVWLVPVASAVISGTDPKVLVFTNANSKTDNFKAHVSTPQGSCQPSSSLSVLVTGTNAVAYVPKSRWGGGGSPGVAVVKVEGTVTPTPITPAIADAVNSCASNAITGQTVCTTNSNKVYVINSTGGGATSTTGSPLTSAGTGAIGFSGGSCTNCGVAMDATHNKAVVGLSIAGVPGFQFLNLATALFEPAFASLSGEISEDPLIDPIRNLLLSAAENNKYEIVNVATSTTPAFFENAISVSGELDSSGEDCATGIALAPAEFSAPSRVFIANLSSTAATFTAGAPGTWTAPSQVQSLTESFLAAGASAIAVAQGAHTGIVSGEFGGNAITAIALPAAIDTSTAVPAISDWVTCTITGFSNGFDPHTVTAYQSPNGGDAIAVLSNGAATVLAVVDLTKMLNTTIVPRTVAGHGCASGSLPAAVVTLVAIP